MIDFLAGSMIDKMLGVVLCFLLHILIICALSYGGVYASYKFEHVAKLSAKVDDLQDSKDELLHQIQSIKQVCPCPLPCACTDISTMNPSH